MKFLLKKVIGNHFLSYEEFITILTEAEAVISRHPLTALDSHAEYGVISLTPGHFLVGRPL